MKLKYLAVLLLPALVACDDDPTELQGCMLSDLPLQGSAAAPRVVDVALEAQPSGIVILATATDPQGTEDLLGVLQAVGVYPDPGCQEAPLVMRDDLAGSGVEESFGMVVDAAASPALYAAIAAADEWPVQLDFRDASGNRTTGIILARVIAP